MGSLQSSSADLLLCKMSFGLRAIAIVSNSVCKNSASLRAPLVTAVARRAKHGGINSSREGSTNGSGGEGGRSVHALALAAGLALAAAAKTYSERERLSLKAETSEVKAHENRVRMFMSRDKIFNYFASFQHISQTGRKDMMMTPLDFYASITPDCSLAFGTGSGVHVDVTDKEVNSGSYYWGKSAALDSLLNKIGEQGLLSYADYCFLLSLLSTPKRFIETAFNLFDVTGDGHINAKEFAYVSSKLAAKSGGFGAYSATDQEEILASSSGLLNFLFGKDRNGKLNREGFVKLHSDLMEEVLQLEFSEYDKTKSGRISERDLCHFLLKNSKIPPKKQAAMLKRVEKVWPSKARGISLPSFRNLFYALASGAELERALFFLDVENIGVDMEEFRKVSSWVTKQELSDHVAKVLFVLIGGDEKGRILKEEISPVLGEWRFSRGFDKGSLQVSLGQLRI